MTAIGLLTVIGGTVFLVTRPGLAHDGESMQSLTAPLAAALSEWKSNHPNECPTLGLVEVEGLLAPEVRRDDVWGGRFRVGCERDGLHLISSGPDGALGTKDDVRIPVQ